ncbi:MAG: M81 family metallopeptidase [Alphaproteobacteria bacterium]|nr:M81 family metallopeptidase [Alphaproteobacteria bacterium]
MNAHSGRRIALLGIILETNAFAPPTTEADFRTLCYLEGDAMLAEARKTAPAMPLEVPGFMRSMERFGPWTPVPVIVTAAEPGGPIDHAFFTRVMAEMRERLKAAAPLDAVYIVNHGAMTSTEEHDPDGALYQMVREVVGPGVPVVATVDLHANISERMVDSVDALISYRTNPHVDQAERGAEAAEALDWMLKGGKARSAFIRLPITPASVTLLTAAGPYADMIAEGQRRMTPDILNVSVVGGFVFSDTPKNGIAVIVTARGDKAKAQALALELARGGWKDRQRFIKTLTPLDEAVRLSVETGSDRSRPAVIYSDAGDNPGGGGRGNTTWLLSALHRAGARGVLVGVFIDPELAAEAHRLGKGAAFRAVFNRSGETEFSKRFAATATVKALSDGQCIGRRGIYAGRSIDLGPVAALGLDGVTVVVGTRRKQCADPIQFECLGLDIANARTVVVKSRGHFRAGFDEFFRPEQVYEVDTAGLTSPVLDRIPFRHLPRPVFPLDKGAGWQEPAWATNPAGA